MLLRHIMSAYKKGHKYGWSLFSLDSKSKLINYDLFLFFVTSPEVLSYDIEKSGFETHLLLNAVTNFLCLWSEKKQ